MPPVVSRGARPFELRHDARKDGVRVVAVTTVTRPRNRMIGFGSDRYPKGCQFRDGFSRGGSIK